MRIHRHSRFVMRPLSHNCATVASTGVTGCPPATATHNPVTQRDYFTPGATLIHPLILVAKRISNKISLFIMVIKKESALKFDKQENSWLRLFNWRDELFCYSVIMPARRIYRYQCRELSGKYILYFGSNITFSPEIWIKDNPKLLAFHCG